MGLIGFNRQQQGGGTENDPSKQNVLSLKARDDRFFRAAESVLKNYKIVRRSRKEEGFVVFDVTGGTRAYTVRIHPKWLENPSCSCPDAAQRAKENARGYCKHIIGVLLSDEEFRCQLLEAFL